MIKKYQLLENDFIEWSGVRLHRIKACRSFGDVREGDLGGYIEHEGNLSHEGTCWIYDNARAYGNAKIADNAMIRHNAMVYNNAKVSGNALIRDTARVRGNAKVYDYSIVQDFAEVDENAKVFGYSRIYDFAKIMGNVKVYDGATVRGDAIVTGNARIYGGAVVGGNAMVDEDARVYGKARIMYGLLTKDIKEDLVQYIACSLNIYPISGKYVLYKRVNKKAPGVYVSLFDPHFVYRDGEYVEAENPDPNFMMSCGGGIHVSTPFYWDEGDTLIAVEVDINDIITCMDGKLRCRKVRVIGEV